MSNAYAEQKNDATTKSELDKAAEQYEIYFLQNTWKNIYKMVNSEEKSYATSMWSEKMVEALIENLYKGKDDKTSKGKNKNNTKAIKIITKKHPVAKKDRSSDQ